MEARAPTFVLDGVVTDLELDAAKPVVDAYVAKHLYLAVDGARIDPSARIEDAILWDDVEVGAGAVVEKCIVTDGVAIPAGSTYHGAVLLAGESGAVEARVL